MSEADDAERFAVQLKQRVRAVAHRFGLIPVAAAGGGAYFFGVIAQLQKQRKRLLRDGLHAIKRHIAHGDAQFSCGGDALHLRKLFAGKFLAARSGAGRRESGRAHADAGHWV